MEEEKTVGLVETFDTGELSTELIPPNFTDPDDLFEILKKTVSSYHPSNDLEMINKAYELAKDAHKDQKIRRTILDSPGMCGDNSCTA